MEQYITLFGDDLQLEYLLQRQRQRPGVENLLHMTDPIEFFLIRVRFGKFLLRALRALEETWKNPLRRFS